MKRYLQLQGMNFALRRIPKAFGCNRDEKSFSRKSLSLVGNIF